MSFIVAGNWKMNKGPLETKEFFNEFFKLNLPSDIRTLFFVPALVAETTSHLFQQMDSIAEKNSHWGLENIYFEASGAFTGENSPQVAKQMGAGFTLVGHSERRSLFGESDHETNMKVKSAIMNGLSPMLCIGETLEERKSDKTLEVLKRQLFEGLKEVKIQNELHVAYEPVWAIGTGEVATTEQVSQAHQFIRKTLKEIFPDQEAKINILYGGSVKPENAAELSQADQVSGFLVGGASLQTNSFFKIIQAVKG